MSPAWHAEWAVALRRRRLLALNVVIPLLLVAPLVLAPAPTPHAAAALAVLFVLFPLFGSAIPLVRDGESGLLMRFLLAGDSPGGHVAGRLAAQALIDLLALLPSVLLVAAWGEGGPGSAAALVAALAWTLLVANAVGAWVAALARSLAEAALFSAVTGLLLLHAGGAFRTPEPGSWQAAVESLVPFRLLHESLLGSLAGGGFGPEAWAGGLGAGGLLLLATWLAASGLMERLAR